MPELGELRVWVEWVHRFQVRIYYSCSIAHAGPDLEQLLGLGSVRGPEPQKAHQRNELRVPLQVRDAMFRCF